MDKIEANNFLREVAVQCYGLKDNEGRSGGAGSIGMICGKPVKFNTHWYERRGKATPEMIASSNALREKLREAMFAVVNDPNRKDNPGPIALKLFDQILDAKDKLLSRKDAATFLKTLYFECYGEYEDDDSKDYFTDACKEAESSKGKDTTFSAVQERIHAKLSAENAQFSMEPWKMKGPVTLLQEKHMGHVLDMAQKQFEEIMGGSEPGFGDALQRDLRGGFTYSFDGETLDLASDTVQEMKASDTVLDMKESDTVLDMKESDTVPKMPEADKQKALAVAANKLKERARAFFGGKNAKLLKFYGNFVDQRCLLIRDRIKDAMKGNDDQFPFYLSRSPLALALAPKGSTKQHINISKLEEGKFRLTVTREEHMVDTLTFPHGDNKKVSVSLKNPTDKNWCSYKYSLDISVYEDGELELAVNEPPIETVCLKSEPEK